VDEAGAESKPKMLEDHFNSLVDSLRPGVLTAQG